MQHSAHSHRICAHLFHCVHQLNLSEVREAEAEYAAGETARFEDVEQLLDELRR